MTHNRFKTGEVWSFPDERRERLAYLRVVLRIGDLKLGDSNPLIFVEDGYLVQISAHKNLTHNSFTDRNLLVAGLILIPGGRWETHGFKRIGALPATTADIEFPCWFIGTDDGPDGDGVRLERGEIKTKVKGLTLEQVEQNWGECLLARIYPETLTEYYIDLRIPQLRPRMRTVDLRYHPRRREIVAATGIDLSTPYFELLSPTRQKVYRRAIED